MYYIGERQASYEEMKSYVKEQKAQEAGSSEPKKCKKFTTANQGAYYYGVPGIYRYDLYIDIGKYVDSVVDIRVDKKEGDL